MAERTQSKKGGKAANPWVVATVVGMAAFMEVLDISIANVALQHIAGSLSATQDESTWILTSYLVTNAVILLMSGWLSSVIGRKKYFVGCIAGFGAASLLCGVAPNLACLIVFRAIQGLIGGGLQPVAQAVLADAFPPEKRNMAFSIYGLAVVFAPAIGPTLGGWITDNYTWRWVFLINVPISIGLTLAALSVVPSTGDTGTGKKKASLKVDYIGFILLALGMGALQIVLDRGQIDDWFGSNLITLGAVVAGTGLLSFVAWELFTPNPIIDLRLMKDANFAYGCVIMTVFGGVLLASTVLLPQFGQEILGYTATEAGKIISPGGFTLALLMPLVGVMLAKIDTRLIIASGLIICILSLLYMTGFNQQIDYYTLAKSRVYQAIGLGFLFIPINTLAFASVQKDKTNAASAIINMLRNVGGSIGISAVTAVLSRREQVHEAYLVKGVALSNPYYRDALAQLQPLILMHVGNDFDALKKTQAVLFRSLEQQARLMAYIDDFQSLAIVFLVLLPFLVFLKKPPAGKAKPAAH